MEPRALISDAYSSTAGDLRCQVRKKLLAFLRDRYPVSLTRTRIELERSEWAGKIVLTQKMPSEVDKHRKELRIFMRAKTLPDHSPSEVGA